MPLIRLGQVLHLEIQSGIVQQYGQFIFVSFTVSPSVFDVLARLLYSPLALRLCLGQLGLHLVCQLVQGLLVPPFQLFNLFMQWVTATFALFIAVSPLLMRQDDFFVDLVRWWVELFETFIDSTLKFRFQLLYLLFEINGHCNLSLLHFFDLSRMYQNLPFEYNSTKISKIMFFFNSLIFSLQLLNFCLIARSFSLKRAFQLV